MSEKPSGRLFTDARLVDPETGRDELGWLAVSGDTILDFGPGPAPTALLDLRRRACRGAALAPALIDLTAIDAEPGPAEAGLAAAAAAGGVGTICVAGAAEPSAGPRLLQLPVADAAIAPGRRRALADVTTTPAETLRLAPTTLASARLTRDLMTAARASGRRLCIRPVEPSFAGGIVHDSPFGWRLGLPTSPAIGEALAIARDGFLAAETGARVLFAGVSSRLGLHALRAARAGGAKVDGAVPVANLLFNEVDVGDLDPQYRLDSPLRSEDDRQALIAAVEAGELVVISGHAPRPEAPVPFASAKPGGATLELLLPALLRFVDEDRWTLPEALAPVTIGPARLFGLPQGRLAPGAPADLVLFDPEAHFKCDPRRLAGGPVRTPFAGRLLQGRVLCTMVAGRFTMAGDGDD